MLNWSEATTSNHIVADSMLPSNIESPFETKSYHIVLYRIVADLAVSTNIESPYETKSYCI